MSKTSRRFKILVMVFLVQLMAILSISLSYENVRTSGRAYKFKIEGYDPIDPFRGRYLQYIINTEGINNYLGSMTGKCYITIKEDEKGYAYLDEAYKEKPKDTDYIIGKRYEGNYYETPFNKYFINETIAFEAEKLFREYGGESYVLVKVKNGKGIVEGLYIGDKRIENYYK